MNKAINARNISERKSNHTQVTVCLGLNHLVVMHVVAFKFLLSSSVHIYKVSFHTDTLTPCQITAAAYIMIGTNIFSYRTWKWYSARFSLIHVQYTVLKVMYLSHAMCHVTSQHWFYNSSLLYIKYYNLYELLYMLASIKSEKQCTQPI